MRTYFAGYSLTIADIFIWAFLQGTIKRLKYLKYFKLYDNLIHVIIIMRYFCYSRVSQPARIL